MLAQQRLEPTILNFNEFPNWDVLNLTSRGNTMKIGKKISALFQAVYNGLGRKIFSAVLMISPSIAFAAAGGGVQTFGDMGTQVGGNATGMSSGALSLFAFIGVCFVGIGFITGKKAHKQNDGLAGPIASAIIGAILLAIPAYISVANSSIFGSDTSETMQTSIGIDG